MQKQNQHTKEMNVISQFEILQKTKSQYYYEPKDMIRQFMKQNSIQPTNYNDSLEDDHNSNKAFELFDQLVLTSQSLKAIFDKNEHLKTQVQQYKNEISYKTLDFSQMFNITYYVIRLQAWARMVLARKRLREQLEQNEIDQFYKRQLQTQTKEEQVLIELKNQLLRKRLTLEGFFRFCDQEQKKSISVYQFKEALNQFGVKMQEGQISRLIMILDEDMEGNITLQEYYDALEAYNVSSEKHLSQNRSNYQSLEQRSLTKLANELQKQNITAIELFNACDINDDQKADIKEILVFIENLTPNFKQKEIHTIINFFDSDKLGYINKSEFIKKINRIQVISGIVFNEQQIPKKLQKKTKQQNNYQENTFMLFQRQNNPIYTNNNLNITQNANKQIINNQDNQKVFIAIYQYIEVQTYNNKRNKTQLTERDIEYFFRLHDVDEMISDMQFQQIFQKCIGKQVTQYQLEKAFQSLNVDQDGFLDLQTLIKTLQENYNAFVQKELNKINELKEQIQSPRESQEQVINKIIQQCQSKDINILSIFRMADTKDQDYVTFTQLATAFKKLLIGISDRDLQFVKESLNLQSNQDIISSSNFQILFSEISQFVPNSESLTTRQHNLLLSENNLETLKEKLHLLDQEQLDLIRKLDNEMLRQEISPSVAFRSADLNHNGIVTVDELKQAIKKILPIEQLSYLELKKTVKVLNIQNNQIIEENDFINIIEYTRNTNIQYIDQKTIKQEINLEELMRKRIKVFDSDHNLKQFFGQFQLTNSGCLQVDQIKQKFQQQFIKQDDDENSIVLQNIIKIIDPDKTSLVEIVNIINFIIDYDLISMQTDFELEYKQIAFVIDDEIKLQGPQITLQYFQQNKIDISEFKQLKGLVDFICKKFHLSIKCCEILINNILLNQNYPNLQQAFEQLCIKIDTYRNTVPDLKQQEINQINNEQQDLSIEQRRNKISIKTVKLDSIDEDNQQKKDINIDLQQDDQLILQLCEHFVNNFENLTEYSILWKALMIFQSHILKFKKFNDAVQDLLQNKTKSTRLSVDQLNKLMKNYSNSLINELSDDQMNLICFLATNKIPENALLIDLKDFIKTMRQIPIDEKFIPIHKKVLQNNLVAVKTQIINLKNKRLSPSKQIQIEQIPPKLDLFDSKLRSYAPSLIKKNTFQNEYQEHENMNQQKIEGQIQDLIIDLRILFKGDRNGKIKNELTQLFINSNDQIISFKALKEFFAQHINIENLKKQLNIMEHLIDSDNQNGRLNLIEFNKFCKRFQIPFESAFALSQSFYRKGKTHSKEYDETLSCGLLTYTISPERDFYIQGINTILNSEKAALVMAEKFYLQLPENQQEDDEQGKFKDPDFGPIDELDDFNKKGQAMYRSGKPPYKSPDMFEPADVQWERAQNISLEGAKFMIHGAASNDVVQGKLGNCWFIGALSVLATRDDKMIGLPDNIKDPEQFQLTHEVIHQFSQGVYPPIFHFYRKKGIYVFRFFKEFKWRYVIIDDRLPCLRVKADEYKLIYGQCKNRNEFWVPLIEKAYAKLHGCYEALTSGFIDDGLNELTGLAQQKVLIQDQQGFPHPKIGDKFQFWQFLKQQKQQKCMLGCSAKQDEVKVEKNKSGKKQKNQESQKAFENEKYYQGQPTGIFTGHAYSLLDVFEIEKNNILHKLLRLRNPWGNKEWSGKWSDNSFEIEEYEREIKEQYIYKLPPEERFNLNEDDGTFLINYQSWRNIFYNLYITHDFPEEWNGVRYFGKWDEKTSGGPPIQAKQSRIKSKRTKTDNWSKNPQYLLVLEKQDVNEYDLFISLAQPDGRSLNEEKKHQQDNEPSNLPKICVMLVQVNKGQERLIQYNNQLIDKSLLKNSREVSMRVQVQPGRYLIVPFTQNIGEYTKYTLSVYMNQDFDERGINIKRIDQNNDDDHYEKIMEEVELVEQDVKFWKKKLCQERFNTIIQVEDAKINTLNQSYMMTKKEKGKGGKRGLRYQISGDPDDDEFGQEDFNELQDNDRDEIDEEDNNHQNQDEEDEYNKIEDDEDLIE